MLRKDIRIGTLVPMNSGAGYIQQILPHGFESFSLTFGPKVAVDFEKTARESVAAVGDKAVISSLGFFGNPLQSAEDVKQLEACIDKVHLFGAALVCAFPGALDGQPVPESMATFKKVWGPLAKRAKDKGVRIAFENCDMGGRWEAARSNIAHAPTAWEMMFNEVPADNLGLEWEPCHQMSSLVDPLPNLRKWLPKIFHLHGKDATIAWDVLKTSGLRGGKPWIWHRTPGFGDTNWTDVITILRQGKWTGSIDIEGWHDPVYCGELEMTGQVRGLNYLKECRGGTFVANPK
jgi:sugar phosphate isomerase/epimerase